MLQLLLGLVTVIVGGYSAGVFVDLACLVVLVDGAGAALLGLVRVDAVLVDAWVLLAADGGTC